MQDISIRYDETLPVPHSLTVFDGYARIEINPRHRARLPLWLLELMQNELLGKIPGPPRTVAVTTERDGTVIDLRTHRLYAVTRSGELHVQKEDATGHP